MTMNDFIAEYLSVGGVRGTARGHPEGLHVCHPVTLTDLKTAGYTAHDLMSAGYTAKEIADAGYTATQLKDAGYTAAILAGHLGYP